jgi:hypothetical protein
MPHPDGNPQAMQATTLSMNASEAFAAIPLAKRVARC